MKQNYSYCSNQCPWAIWFKWADTVAYLFASLFFSPGEFISKICIFHPYTRQRKTVVSIFQWQGFCSKHISEPTYQNPEQIQKQFLGLHYRLLGPTGHLLNIFMHNTGPLTLLKYILALIIRKYVLHTRRHLILK